jgi:SAM-dependent methyltransferase
VRIMKPDPEDFAEKIRQEQWARREAFRIIGVDEGASEQDIKRAYRMACHKHHPDHNPDDREANRRFLLVQCAYELLTEGTICPMLLEKMQHQSPSLPRQKYDTANPWGYFLWWREEFFDGSPESDGMAAYTRSCKADFWQEIFRAEADYLAEHLRGCRDILSVGCGPADVESILSRQGFSLTGLDVSQEALGQAPEGIRKVAGRAEEMPFGNASFDAVIYVASMQFIEDYPKAIERTSDVLRPGGRLIALLLNPASAFFMEKMKNPASYVRRMKHADMNGIENAVTQHFSVRTEYFLGIADGKVCDARNSTDAVLYIIDGTKKNGDNSRS